MTMKAKKEYLILVLVIVALAAYLVLRKTDRTHYRLPELEAVPAVDITRIDIIGPTSTVVLNKSADKWGVADAAYPADEGKVQQMLDAIGGLTLTALVSEAESYDRYDLSDDKKIAVKAWAGDTLKRDFELGKAASSFKHTFVKIAGDRRVYHAQDNLRFNFDQTVDSLRDKTVLTFEIKDIREMAIAADGRTSVLRRREPEASPDGSGSGAQKDPKGAAPADAQPAWQGENGEDLDAAKVDRLLSTLNGMECDAYIYGRDKGDLKDPVYTLGLKGTTDHVLQIFSRSEPATGNYPAVSSQNPYPFELTPHRAEDIMNTLAETEKADPQKQP